VRALGEKNPTLAAYVRFNNMKAVFAMAVSLLLLNDSTALGQTNTNLQRLIDDIKTSKIRFAVVYLAWDGEVRAAYSIEKMKSCAKIVTITNFAGDSATPLLLSVLPAAFPDPATLHGDFRYGCEFFDAHSNMVHCLYVTQLYEGWKMDGEKEIPADGWKTDGNFYSGSRSIKDWFDAIRARLPK